MHRPKVTPKADSLQPSIAPSPSGTQIPSDGASLPSPKERGPLFQHLRHAEKKSDKADKLIAGLEERGQGRKPPKKKVKYENHKKLGKTERSKLSQELKARS
jgi:hypothetical protein